MNSKYKKVLYLLFVGGILLFIYKMTTQPTNNADKYFQEYFDKIEPFPVVAGAPTGLGFDKFKGGDIYKRGFSLLGYKVLLGKIEYMCVEDTISHKYFHIYLIDDKKQRMFVLRQATRDRSLYLYVNSEDLANPEYGTKERPIPAFSFKGVDKPLLIPVGNDRHENLEPTQAEFEHIVRCYLTYVMSKEEFKARFKDRKK